MQIHEQTYVKEGHCRLLKKHWWVAWMGLDISKKPIQQVFNKFQGGEGEEVESSIPLDGPRPMQTKLQQDGKGIT